MHCAGHIPSVGPKEVDPAEPREADVPLRTVPGLLQGGQGLQREVQVPLQDEDAGQLPRISFRTG